MVSIRSMSTRQRGKPTEDSAESEIGEQDFAQIKRTLASQQAFVMILLEKAGNVRVLADEHVKGFLDARNLGAQVQNAYERSRASSLGGELPAEVNAEDEGLAADDSADNAPPASVNPATKTRGRRVFQSERQRGRPVQARHPNISSCPTPPPEPTSSDRVSSATVAHEAQTQPQKRIKSFRIDESAAVTDFLVNRLKRMQQLADKKIAKAWIKGICPKKQAKYPYQNNKQKKETGVEPEVPPWWPALETCPFTEPDHIKREQRMRLCLHLLRLRPSPEQLKEWNRYDTEPSKTHVGRGWTAWLKELAGHEVFDDLPKDSSHRIKHRQGLMDQMYEVAELEEDYLRGGIDGDLTYSYADEDEERKNYSAKRCRESSATLTPEFEEATTRSASVSYSGPSSKRPRRESASPSASTMYRQASIRKIEQESRRPRSPVSPVDAQLSSATTSFNDSFGTNTPHSESVLKVDTSVYAHHTAQRSPATAQHHTHSLPRYSEGQSLSWRSYEESSSWSAPVSEYCGPQGSNLPYQLAPAPNTFPGRQDFEFAPYPQVQQPYLAHMVHVSQPEFHTTPTTPVYSPNGLTSLPVHNFGIPQTSMPEAVPTQHFPMTMAPAQYFVAAEADPTVADFQPPMGVNSQQYHQYQSLPDVTAAQTPSVAMGQPIQWHHHHHSRH